MELTDGPDVTQPAEPDAQTRALWSEADEIWERFQNDLEFRAFVSADYHDVYRALVALQGRVATFLEWGSGLGVVTIMASNLGFEAHGIESEQRLVDRSRELAQRYGRGAQFITGTFIPREYEWSVEHSGESFRSDIEAEPAYDELDMELRDFDLIYAYPWPDEQALFRHIIRECGGEDALLLLYDAREGIMLSRPGRGR